MPNLYRCPLWAQCMAEDVERARRCPHVDPHAQDAICGLCSASCPKCEELS